MNKSGEKIYEPLSVLEADAPVTLATYDGWKRHKNLAKSDKHNLSSLAPPKGVPHQALYVLVNLHLERSTKSSCYVSPHQALYGTLTKLNQEIKLCITKHIPLRDSSVHTGTPFTVPSSSSESNRVSNSHSSLATTPSSRMILGKPKIEVTKVLTDQVGKNEEYFHGANWHNSTLNHVEGKLVHHLELQKGPSHLDHQLDQQRDPTSSPYPDMSPNPGLSLTITLLLVGHSYYFLKKMGRDLTSTSLMAYLKYSFDIEEGFSNFISIKQYGSPYNLPDLGQHESSYNLLNQWDPGEKPLLPQLFRKATATKIIYFLWIQSEYNLSYKLSKHWELLKIPQVIQKLLIL